MILEWNGSGYTVTAPALPGGITEGDTGAEEMENAWEAMAGYLEALKLQGKPHPERDPGILYGEAEVSL